MADLAFTPAERAFLAALDELGVRYLVVGLSAAVLQGADTVTAAIDLWFADRSFGGNAPGARFDVAPTLSGLEEFESEAREAKSVEVDGLLVPVLPLERIIHSKRSAGRAKDLAVLPALEAALAATRDGS